MSAHPNEHLETLAPLLAGELGPTDPRAARLLRECAVCRAEWARLGATAAALERAAAERDEVLAGQARLGPAPGEERLHATLAAAARAGRPARRRALLRLVLWAAAAAAVAAVLWRGLRTEAPPQAPVYLGGDGLELLEPRGAVADFARFAWTYPVPGTRYDLSIFERSDGQGRRACHVEKGCATTSWEPTAELRASLPDEIEWEVSVLDEFGARGPTASAVASRR